jgi:hypothetical protein
MVEGMVVIPVLLVFVGLIKWTHDGYARKQDRQMMTRSSLMAYTSKACSGNAAGSTLNQESGPDVNNEAGSQGMSSPDSTGGSGAAMSGKMSMAHSRPTDVTVNGRVINDRRSFQLTRNIHAESENMCNEKVYDGFWGALGGYAKDLLGGGFGKLLGTGS